MDNPTGDDSDSDNSSTGAIGGFFDRLSTKAKQPNKQNNNKKNNNGDTQWGAHTTETQTYPITYFTTTQCTSSIISKW